MGDLISRSALIEEINTWAMQCKSIAEISILGAVVSMVENQPTAYDVDKVVAELESKLATTWEKHTIESTRSDGYWIPIQSKYSGRIEELINAIDIVKRGGRDDMG